jgi:hypothetical protein
MPCRMARHDQRHDGVRAGACRPGPPRPEAGAKGRPRARAARRLDQHQARGADTGITRAIDAHADAELRREDSDGGAADGLAPVG